MKKLILTLLLSSGSFILSGGDFSFKGDYRYYFDNREFDRSDNALMKSMTINAMRATLLGEYSITEGSATSKIVGAVNLMKDLGQGSTVYGGNSSKADTWDIIKDFNVYYDLNKTYRGGGVFHGVFGIYPSSLMEEDYSRAFISDSVRFYDCSYEGMVLQYSKGHFNGEIALDWMGLKGQLSRERFRIFGGINFHITEYLSAATHFSIYHYAGSIQTPGVIDNSLVNPFLKLDLSDRTFLDVCSLKAGALVSYQRDREFDEGAHVLCGLEAIADICWHSIGIENTFYKGDGLMPFSGTFHYGYPVGPSLYFGSSHYRSGFFNRMDCYWSPSITDNLSLKLSCSMLFASSGYQGMRQILSVNYLF